MCLRPFQLADASPVRPAVTRRMETEGSKIRLQFEHPTVAGPSPGGWMGNQAGGWKARRIASAVAAHAGKRETAAFAMDLHARSHAAP